MKSGIRVLIGCVIALTALGGSAAAQAPGPSADARQRLTLAAPQRDQVLAEMRTMLGSVSGVVGALAADDLAAAEKAARASGLGMAADVDPAIRQSLPPSFLQLGMRTHKGFDQLADAIKAGIPRQQVLRELAGLTSNCVACHAQYRLDETR